MIKLNIMDILKMENMKVMEKNFFMVKVIMQDMKVFSLMENIMEKVYYITMKELNYMKVILLMENIMELVLNIKKMGKKEGK